MANGNVQQRVRLVGVSMLRHERQAIHPRPPRQTTAASQAPAAMWQQMVHSFWRAASNFAWAASKRLAHKCAARQRKPRTHSWEGGGIERADMRMHQGHEEEVEQHAEHVHATSEHATARQPEDQLSQRRLEHDNSTAASAHMQHASAPWRTRYHMHISRAHRITCSMGVLPC